MAPSALPLEQRGVSEGSEKVPASLKASVTPLFLRLLFSSFSMSPLWQSTFSLELLEFPPAFLSALASMWLLPRRLLPSLLSASATAILLCASRFSFSRQASMIRPASVSRSALALVLALAMGKRVGLISVSSFLVPASGSAIHHQNQSGGLSELASAFPRCCAAR